MIQEKTLPKTEEQRQVGFQREVEEQGEPEVLQQKEEVGGQEGVVMQQEGEVLPQEVEAGGRVEGTAAEMRGKGMELVQEGVLKVLEREEVLKVQVQEEVVRVQVQVVVVRVQGSEAVVKESRVWQEAGELLAVVGEMAQEVDRP